MKILSRCLCGPSRLEVESNFEGTPEYQIGQQRVRTANPGFEGIPIMPRNDGHNRQRAVAWKKYISRSLESLELYEWRDSALDL